MGNELPGNYEIKTEELANRKAGNDEVTSRVRRRHKTLPGNPEVQSMDCDSD